MDKKYPALRSLGFIIFMIGIILGILLDLVRSMPDLEASLYGFIRYGYPTLKSLSCPMMMTTLDSEQVKIRLTNDLDRNLNYYIEAQFSGPLITTVEDRRVLQPKESQTLAWNVDKSNVDLGVFIFAKLFTSAATTRGMREASCGIFVLPLSMNNGPLIFYSTIIVSAVFIAIGMLLWHRNVLLNEQGSIRAMWMYFITVVVVVGVVSGIFNAWFLGIAMVILAVLSFGVFLIPQRSI